VERRFEIAAIRKAIGLNAAEGHIIEIPAFDPTPVSTDQGESDGQQ
jgi:hypothetical protein